MHQLQSYSYYNDLYDKFTVEDCRNVISNTIKYEESKNIPGERKFRSNIYELYVSFVMIDRALGKKEIIEKWMERDRQRDIFSNSIKPPKVKCNVCSKQMNLDDTSFMIGVGDEKDRLLFMFHCEDCNKRRGIYSDGEEIIPEKHPCPNCNIEFDKKTSIKDGILTIHYTCSKCNHKETEVLDFGLTKKEEKEDLNYEEDRKRFCISEEEGNKLKNKVLNFYQGLIDVMTGKDPATIARRKEQEKYEPLENIKRFTISELEEYLSPKLAEKGFINFSLGKAEIDKEIHVYFTIIDKTAKDQKHSSRTRLRKIINESLNDTNWFFMNSGRLEEKLGIIQGRLKGVDNNDELLKLVQK